MPARRLAARLSALASAAVAVPIPVLAHHPMGGAPAATVWQGIASGVAHPVIGIDHLAFLLAAGVLASVAPQRLGIPALVAFLGAGLGGALLHLAGFGLGGALLHLAGFGLGAVEALVALSVLLARLAMVTGQRLTPAGLALGFGAAGLVHGHALAEAVTGAPATTIAAYLLTLAVTQGAIGFGAMATATRWAGPERRMPQRLAGLGTAAFGAVALVVAVVA